MELTVMDYISFVAIATGLACIMIQLYLHDFDLEATLFGKEVIK